MPTQTDSGISPPANTAIIGRLPGYNKNIDSNGQFVSQLLKGLTFIDLIPTAYRINTSSGANVLDILQTAFSGQGSPWVHMSGDRKPLQFYQEILSGMQKGLNLDPTFDKVESLRIIGANDSTFTENLSNMFDGANSLNTGQAALAQQIDEKSKGLARKMSNTIKSVDYTKAMELFTEQSFDKTWWDTLKGSALGVSFARPGTWNTSQYNSTLTMFIKLVSPSGNTNCIKKNILQPLLYLIAAGAPMTVHGFAYGIPLIWDVHAHGITRFKLGSLAALTISRGSFETTFNDKYQPTVIDVRMTIIPLMQDFAVEHNTNNPGKMYKDKSALGVQHPGDIYSGSMNEIGEITGSNSDSLKEIKIIEL